MRSAFPKRNRAAERPPEAEGHASCMLTDVPAAAKVAASPKVAAAEAAHVAKIPAGEMISAAVEAMTVPAIAAVPAIAIAVIRVPPTVTVVVTGAIVRPVGIAAAVVRIGRRGA